VFAKGDEWNDGLALDVHLGELLVAVVENQILGEGVFVGDDASRQCGRRLQGADERHAEAGAVFADG
jgi:hypothetical protein